MRSATPGQMIKNMINLLPIYSYGDIMLLGRGQGWSKQNCFLSARAAAEGVEGRVGNGSPRVSGTRHIARARSIGVPIRCT